MKKIKQQSLEMHREDVMETILRTVLIAGLFKILIIGVRLFCCFSVSFHEGMTAFADKFSYTISDPEHSMGEYRFLLLGQCSSGNLLVISHTERGDRIRIISVRRATKQERELYKQGQP